MKYYKKRLLLLFYIILTFVTVVGLGLLTRYPNPKDAAIYGTVLMITFITFTLRGLHKSTRPALMEYVEHQSVKRMNELEKAINALADPRMSKEDLKNYLEKGKMLMEFVEEEEKRHLRMTDRNVKALTGSLMGHSNKELY